MPAWTFSVLIHLVVIVLLGLTLRPTPKGLADDPVRTAGIVLKQTTDNRVTYEGEDGQWSSETFGSDAASDMADPLSALPHRDTIKDPATALPELQDRDDLGLHDGLVPDAGGLTRGGATGQPNAPSGGKASVNLFGLEGEGRKIVYVFDRSTSMEEGGRLAAAKAELIRSLAGLDSTHQFQIIFFNHHPRVFDLSGGQRRIPFATEPTKRQATKFIRSITASGNTERLSALKMAVGMRPDVIFFLTDEDSPMSADELKEIRRLNQRIASINTIQFCGIGNSSGPANFLVRLSQQNGGKYIYIDRSKLRSD